jgi:hypothetical protein
MIWRGSWDWNEEEISFGFVTIKIGRDLEDKGMTEPERYKTRF